MCVLWMIYWIWYTAWRGPGITMFRRPGRNIPSCRGLSHCKRDMHVLSSPRTDSWNIKALKSEKSEKSLSGSLSRLTCSKCSICCRLGLTFECRSVVEEPGGNIVKIENWVQHWNIRWTSPGLENTLHRLSSLRLT